MVVRMDGGEKSVVYEISKWEKSVVYIVDEDETKQSLVLYFMFCKLWCRH